MKLFIVFVTLLCLISGSWQFVTPGLDPFSDEMINRINDLGTTWKAGQNFNGFSLDSFKRLLGASRNTIPKKLIRKTEIRIANDLPESFDSREAWPNCSSIKTIRDQGSCGSCWAFAGVGILSDRLCIHRGIEVLLSAQQVTTCSGKNGCSGGMPYQAFQLFQTEGLVTGGLYGGGGCSPYTLEPCEHHVDGPLTACMDYYLPTPECRKECVPEYGKSWDEDKFYGQEPYQVGGEDQIMFEIMTNGPVAAVFDVRGDFPNYKSGVYQWTTGYSLGAHAIKIIGWGVENGTNYWTVANSWNDHWGDKGYFKIRRGNNECGIEDNVAASLPRLEDDQMA